MKQIRLKPSKDLEFTPQPERYADISNLHDRHRGWAWLLMTSFLLGDTSEIVADFYDIFPEGNIEEIVQEMMHIITILGVVHFDNATRHISACYVEDGIILLIDKKYYRITYTQE